LQAPRSAAKPASSIQKIAIESGNRQSGSPLYKAHKSLANTLQFLTTQFYFSSTALAV
jgi:hypothetical protein